MINEIPKLKEYQVSSKYFEDLPDQILEKIDQKSTFLWVKMTAAAILLLGIGIWQMVNFENEVSTLSFDQESELYIESEFWSEEEILSLSVDPNAILDEILTEEVIYLEDIWTKEEQTWF